MIQFANATIGTVYTNILDHIRDHEKFFGEVYRVLVPKGVFLVDIDQNLPDFFAIHDLRITLGRIENLLRAKFGDPVVRKVITNEKDPGKIAFMFVKSE